MWGQPPAAVRGANLRWVSQYAIILNVARLVSALSGKFLTSVTS